VEVIRVTGSFRSSRKDSESASASDRAVVSPLPKTRSRHVSRSMVGVTVWLRTNSRDCWVR
jgi:hypothetical protein